MNRWNGWLTRVFVKSWAHGTSGTAANGNGGNNGSTNMSTQS